MAVDDWNWSRRICSREGGGQRQIVVNKVSTGTDTPYRHRYALQVQIRLTGIDTPYRYRYALQIPIRLTDTDTPYRYLKLISYRQLFVNLVKIIRGQTSQILHFSQPTGTVFVHSYAIGSLNNIKMWQIFN